MIPEASALSFPGYLCAVIDGDGQDIITYNCFTSELLGLFPQLMWPYLIPGSVLDSYPLILFSEDRNELLPLESEN